MDWDEFDRRVYASGYTEDELDELVPTNMPPQFGNLFGAIGTEINRGLPQTIFKDG